MQKYVVSSTLGEPGWTNSKVVSVDDVAGLREADGGDLLVNGSAQLVAELLERDLVDELRLMVFPTVLGAGRRLFGDAGAPKPLRLVESRPVGPDGVLILIYQPVTRED
jgi:dihydrofolate reductase